MKLYTIAFTLLVAFAGAQNCTLCPDGSPPPDLDLSVEGIDLSCGELENLATAAQPDACEDISRFAAACACLDQTVPFCSLCPNGEPPPDMDLVLPNQATCGNVDALAREETTENGCAALRNYAAAACGCEGQVVSPVDTCTTLCPDGSQVPDPCAIVGEIITGKTVTCGDVQAQVALGVQDQETCNTYALMGVYKCGCKSTLAEQPCQLCEDGSVPPNLLHDVDGKGNTCVELMTSMMYVNDTLACMAFQATGGVYCGCDNPVSSQDACRICGKDQLLPNPSRIAEASSDISCREAEYVANLEGSSSCSDMQGDFAATCCGPDAVNPTNNDNDDLLPSLDGIHVDATSPPEVQPQGSTAIDDNSSAPGPLTVLPLAAIMIVAFHMM